MSRMLAVSLPLVLVIVLLCSAPLATLAQEATPAAGVGAVPAGVEIVANGLDNPRNFTWDDAGTLYLAIAGIGGPSMGEIGGSPSGLTGGPTASVVPLDGGCATIVSGELPSSVWEGVGWVWGTADVTFLDGQLYQLAGGGGSDYGNFDSPAGVYRVEDDGSSTLVADYSAWSRENMPEFVPPDFNADGTLNDMFALDGQLWVVDAVSGRIIKVTPDGEITPFRDYSVEHPVPTGIVPDGEGGLYVSNLTAIPYPIGAAKVVQIDEDGVAEDVWTGLTAVTSLAMGPDGALYASEMVSEALDEDPFLAPNTGRVVRQTGADSFEEIVTNLPYPISIGFGPDDALYIGVPAFGTGTGQGQGALLRVDPSVPLPVSLAGVDLTTPTCRSAAAAPATATPGTEDADATPESAAAPTEMTQLLGLPLADQTMGAGEVLGVTRLTFDVGGSQETSAGAGASVYFVENGTLSLIPAEDSPALLVFRGGGLAGATPESVDAGAETTLGAGDGLILPAGSRAELRNAADEPANLLRLLAAGDAAADAETGVSRAVLVRELEALAAPGTLTLQQTTLPAGGQLQYPAAPALAVVAGLDRGQAVYLSMGSAGSATNRSPDPMEIYLLTLEPAS